MKCNKFKEQIILYLYGELSEKESSELESHLGKCSECSKDLEYTKKIFNLLKDAEIEETTEANWEKCWKGINTGISETTGKSKNYFFFPRWAFVSAAVILVLFIGIFIGRFWVLSSQKSFVQETASREFIHQTLKEHFEELKPILVEYSNYPLQEKSSTSIMMDKKTAQNLIIQNILLKRIVSETNPAAAQLFEDVDMVLREIANQKSEDKESPALIKEAIDKRDILFKMEILQKI